MFQCQNMFVVIKFSATYIVTRFTLKIFVLLFHFHYGNRKVVFKFLSKMHMFKMCDDVWSSLFVFQKYIQKFKMFLAKMKFWNSFESPQKTVF